MPNDIWLYGLAVMHLCDGRRSRRGAIERCIIIIIIIIIVNENNYVLATIA